MQAASIQMHQNQARETAAVLAEECGDFLSGMFHPAFKELAFWRKREVIAFTPDSNVMEAFTLSKDFPQPTEEALNKHIATLQMGVQ